VSTKGLEATYWDAIGLGRSRTQPGGLWRDHCDAVHLRWLARWLPESPTPVLLKTDLFDEAFGGGLHRYLKERAGLVVGMDLSGSVAQAARARQPGLQAICADVRILPFAGNAVDVVVSNSTLDHFHSGEEFQSSLREIHRVLAPGGRLLLTMDNPVNPAVAFRNALPFALLNRLRIVPYFVGVTFGPGRLCALLAQNGFDVLNTSAIMHNLRVLTVPLCKVLQRQTRTGVQAQWLRLLMGCEALARLPFRYLTGNFVTVVAIKKTPES